MYVNVVPLTISRNYFHHRLFLYPHCTLHHSAVRKNLSFDTTNQQTQHTPPMQTNLSRHASTENKLAHNINVYGVFHETCTHWPTKLHLPTLNPLQVPDLIFDNCCRYYFHQTIQCTWVGSTPKTHRSTFQSPYTPQTTTPWTVPRLNLPVRRS